MEIIWEQLKGDRYGWTAKLFGPQGALREMCWALSQRESQPQQGRLSLQVTDKKVPQPLNTVSRCSIHRGKRVFVSVCILFVCL